MRKTKFTKLVSVVLAVLMLMSIVPFACLSASAQTSEPPLDDGYYLISDLSELDWFAQQVNSGNTDINARLTSDIFINMHFYDESNIYKWTPIGNYTHKYSGTFDGDNHTINGVYIDEWTLTNAGFFGVIKDAEIKNLNFKNTYILGNNIVGGVCGENEGGTISHCSVHGNINSKNNFAGGICGESYGTISDCFVSAQVIANFMYAGGICGVNYNKIENCYSSCSSVSSTYYHGGIFGGSRSGEIKNCYYDSSIGWKDNTNITNTTVTDVLGVPTATFESGEVAYLLNKGVTDGTQVFYQNLDNNEMNDVYPGFKNNGHNTVYMSEQENYKLYSNSENPEYLFKKNSDGCFVIESYEQLCAMADRINNHDVNYKDADYILANDIDCRGENALDKVSVLNGTFDGNGFAIRNLNVDSGRTNGSRHSLFTTISNSGVVKNLTVSNADVYSTYFPVMGSAAIAKVNDGTIENCIVEGSTIQLSNLKGLGGIVGTNNGTIKNCCVIDTEFTRLGAASSQTSDKSIGGIAEFNYGTISECFTYNCTFTDGNATTKGGIVSSGNAPVNCYHYTQSEVGTAFDTAKTAEEFASGEVAYLLNNGVTDGSQQWYQNVTNDKEKDLYPKHIGGIVFKNDKDDSYSNTASDHYLITEDNYEKYGISEDYIGYHLLFDEDDLFWFAQQVDNEYNTEIKVLLMNDVTFTDPTRLWTPVGETWKPFTGTFDGLGHTISGFTFTDRYGAMFYSTTGNIKNLNIKDINIPDDKVYDRLAGFAYHNGGLIENCHFDSVISNGETVAGICCSNNGGAVINCTSSGDYTAIYDGGGICYDNSGTVKGCTNYANVTAPSTVAGIVSYNTGTVINCVNRGDIFADKTLKEGSYGFTAGGIVGRCEGDIKDCENSGNIKGEYRCGGIAGTAENCVIDNCTTSGTVTATTLFGDICGQVYGNSATITNCTVIAKDSDLSE